MPLGIYFAIRRIVYDLKKAREAAGLSLADVAEKSGIDKAALSRLENGVHDNPTVETLMRYAAAVGKKLTWKLEDLAPAG
jgi:transcriptional regulator with XRE-family HTH domain